MLRGQPNVSEDSYEADSLLPEQPCVRQRVLPAWPGVQERTMRLLSSGRGCLQSGRRGLVEMLLPGRASPLWLEMLPEELALRRSGQGSLRTLQAGHRGVRKHVLQTRHVLLQLLEGRLLFGQERKLLRRFADLL